MSKDNLRRFLLDRSNIRGSWVNLEQAWQTVQERAEYPEGIQQLLGEALAAAALLSATIKHSGSLILQIRGEGDVHLLVAQATPAGDVRGLARWNHVPEVGADLHTCFGDKAQMVITLESLKNNERYQGIVELKGKNLAEALERYFETSEQLPTRIQLAASTENCAGLLIQQLPEHTDVNDLEEANEEFIEEDWVRVSSLIATATADEMLTLDSETLIYRLFHEEEPRVFEYKPMRFYCDCSRERVERTITNLGQEEVNSIIEEQGSISVTCEFCNATYAFDAIDINNLFIEHHLAPNTTLH